VKNISELIKNRKIVRDYRNSHEYQAYGNKLAEDLGDIKHRALYIKLAKNEDRNLMEIARIYVTSRENITTRGRLFMWKLKQLKDERLNKQKN